MVNNGDMQVKLIFNIFLTIIYLNVDVKKNLELSRSNF